MTSSSWRRSEVRFLGTFAVVIAAGLGFLKFASEVQEGETQAIDERILQSLSHLNSPMNAEVMRDITALGSVAVLVLVTISAAVGLMLAKRRKSAFGLTGAIIACATLNWILKLVYARPRPSVVAQLTAASGDSFPSGHSMLAAAVYLTVGSFIATAVAERRYKIAIMALASFITIIVGVSRCFLGVHYPSDVAAGWLVGAIFALVVGIVALPRTSS